MSLGLTGQVVLGDDLLELRGAGPPVSIEPGTMLLDQWPLLPPDLRRRKAFELAERLAAAHRFVGGTLEQRASPFSVFERHRVLKVLGAIVVLLVVIGGVRVLLRSTGGSDRADAGVPNESDAQRRDRLSRACNAMRDRIHRGASFGPFATEGWVVELWLANRSGKGLQDHPALSRIIAGGKLAAEADDALASVSDGSVEITDGFGDEEAKRSPEWRGATILFREGYARAYLEIDTRPRFLSLAERLFEGTGAELGALYARCADGTAHDVGSWYRGSDAAGATTALVRAMGFFADGVAIDRGSLKPTDAKGELDALRTRAGSIDAETLSRIIGQSSGSITTTGVTTVTFPLGAPTKASAASRELARRMGIATGGD